MVFARSRIEDANAFIGETPKPEADAFDKMILKEFSVQDCLITEFEVGGAFAKSTLYICLEHLLNKKPKLNICYREITSLKCIKKKVFIITSDSTESILKCKNIEMSTAIFNLIRELYHIQTGKALETIELGEKNAGYQKDEAPKPQEPPKEEEDNTKKGGIVAKMLGKTNADFNVLIANKQECKYEDRVSHELNFITSHRFAFQTHPSQTILLLRKIRVEIL